MANISDEDARKMLAHIKAKLPGLGLPNCPICGTRGWTLGGVRALQDVREVTQQGSDNVTFETTELAMPVYLVVCGTCYYALQFAWTPIRKGSVE